MQLSLTNLGAGTRFLRASFPSNSQLKNWGLEEDLLLCPTKYSGKAEGEAKLSPLN